MEKYHKAYNQEDMLSNIFLNKGIIQYKAGDLLGSELSLLKSYSGYKNSKNKEKLYGVTNELGLVYNELSDYNKSIFLLV